MNYYSAKTYKCRCFNVSNIVFEKKNSRFFVSKFSIIILTN